MLSLLLSLAHVASLIASVLVKSLKRLKYKRYEGTRSVLYIYSRHGMLDVCNCYTYKVCMQFRDVTAFLAVFA